MENFNYSIVLDQSPTTVFNAVRNVPGWWSEEVTGSSDNLHDVFDYHFKDVHRCKIKLVEVIRDRKIVWQVMENSFNFTKDQTEWVGNQMVFEITERNGKTALTFTQIGLTTAYECFDICRDAWSHYINGSLRNLIATGKGQPNPKEGGFNEALLEQHNKQ